LWAWQSARIDAAIALAVRRAFFRRAAAAAGEVRAGPASALPSHSLAWVLPTVCDPGSYAGLRRGAVGSGGSGGLRRLFVIPPPPSRDTLRRSMAEPVCVAYDAGVVRARAAELRRPHQAMKPITAACLSLTQRHRQSAATLERLVRATLGDLLPAKASLALVDGDGEPAPMAPTLEDGARRRDAGCPPRAWVTNSAPRRCDIARAAGRGGSIPAGERGW
jgi:hypothetical protein